MCYFEINSGFCIKYFWYPLQFPIIKFKLINRLSENLYNMTNVSLLQKFSQIIIVKRISNYVNFLIISFCVNFNKLIWIIETLQFQLRTIQSKNWKFSELNTYQQLRLIRECGI